MKSKYAAALAVSLLIGAPAHAQTSDSSTTVKLIELLVKNGVLSREQAGALLKQAQDEARTAPARPARVARAPGAPGAAGTALAPSEAEVPSTTVRVTYVPEIVRQQIASEVRNQVLAEARSEGWAAPNQIPDWVNRVRITGDLRVRGEGDFFQSQNFNEFENYNAINGSSNGFDTSANGTGFGPLLDTTKDRNRFRLRARLDIASTIADWIDGDIRIATGNDSSPVSTNQTFGVPGDFSKYALWLDRAYIKMRPADWLTISTGRMPNPFWETDLVYDEDLNFDGIDVLTQARWGDGFGAFLTGGAFPVFNTDFNFGSTNQEKTRSRDAYLAAVQGGGEWRINDNYLAKLAVGYYDFAGVQGATSSPCFNPTSFGSCDTDNTRPGFLQFGNTLFPLRTITQSPTNPNGPTPQFYGLASRFEVLDVHGRFDIANFDPIHVALEGEYAKNLGYNRAAAEANNANNFGGSLDKNKTFVKYEGGDTAYLMRLLVGHPKLEKLWDWDASFSYKYLETDAVLDALTDSDFHLGGTNAKGFVLTGELALNRNLWFTAKWYSSNQVSGPLYGVDTIFVDLNARF